MKKALFAAAAAVLSLAACTKTGINAPVRNEIGFQPANYLTKVDGGVFPGSESFEAYAWTDGTVGEYFMDGVTVSFNSAEGLWKPVSTYYWPVDRTVDFQCGYPAGLSGVKFDKQVIDYTAIDVEALQQDVMYSDKAVGYSENTDEVSDGQNAYTGVPVLFRHALAKVRVEVIMGYESATETDGTLTEWAMTLDSFNLKGIYTTGDCHLTLSDPSATGVVGWTKPADASGYNVWTPDGTGLINSVERLSAPLALNATTPVVAVAEFYVLPQTLSPMQQAFDLSVSVNTSRNGAPFLTETGLVRSAGFYTPEIEAWQMNHSYVYRLVLLPLGGEPSTKVITFDPAVADWESEIIVSSIVL